MSLEDEFSRYSNKQAYDAVFASRMMLRDAEQPDRVIGNTQRADFLPVLHALLDTLPARPHLFDVGAGAGDIVELALSRLDAATVHVEEPNEALLERYQQRLAQYPALELGHVFAQPLEEVLANWTGSRPPFVVDGVLAIHMLYFVEDLVATMRALYQSVKPGGVLFVVIADQQQSTTGRAGRYHYQRLGNEDRVQQLDQIWTQREALFGQGDIASLLDPGSPPSVDIVRNESWLYGRSEDDMIAMCLSGELLVADDDAFDMRKLESCREFLHKHGREVDFGIEATANRNDDSTRLPLVAVDHASLVTCFAMAMDSLTGIGPSPILRASVEPSTSSRTSVFTPSDSSRRRCSRCSDGSVTREAWLRARISRVVRRRPRTPPEEL